MLERIDSGGGGGGLSHPVHATGGGGANLARVRAHNERLVLSLLRAAPRSRAELARRTGLSAQTISQIVRALHEEGLVRSGTPVRGRVGQPSVPLMLDPRGAWFAGLQIGRRGAELVLIDFEGTVLERQALAYPWPDPERVVRFVTDIWPRLTAGIPRERLHGLGIAMPLEPWQWPETLGAPVDVGRRWRDADAIERIRSAVALPVHVENDVTAACGAELTFGEGRHFRDFAYFFVGHFIGGGIVLDSAVHGGRRGNAAAFGSLPVPDPARPGSTMQLIDAASVHVLESMLPREGERSTAPALRDRDSPLWTRHATAVGHWQDLAGEALATAITAIASVVEIEAVIVDGVFPGPVREGLCRRTRTALATMDTRGIETPVVVEGSIGGGARTLGAARLPLFARFLLDQDVLTRQTG